MTKCTIVLVQVGSHPDRQCTLVMGEDRRFLLLNLALMGHVRTGAFVCGYAMGWLTRSQPKPSRLNKKTIKKTVIRLWSFYFLMIIWWPLNSLVILNQEKYKNMGWGFQWIRARAVKMYLKIHTYNSKSVIGMRFPSAVQQALTDVISFSFNSFLSISHEPLDFTNCKVSMESLATALSTCR